MKTFIDTGKLRKVGGSGTAADLEWREARSVVLRAYMSGPGQPIVHAVPLSVKLVGAAALPVWLTWNPMLVLPPAGMVAL